MPFKRHSLKLNLCLYFDIELAGIRWMLLKRLSQYMLLYVVCIIKYYTDAGFSAMYATNNVILLEIFSQTLVLFSVPSTKVISFAMSYVKIVNNFPYYNIFIFQSINANYMPFFSYSKLYVSPVLRLYTNNKYTREYKF